MKELGLSVNQKWNTDNTLATEVTVEDQVDVVCSQKTDHIRLFESFTVNFMFELHPQLAQGLKVGLDTSFVPNTG